MKRPVWEWGTPELQTFTEAVSFKARRAGFGHHAEDIASEVLLEWSEAPCGGVTKRLRLSMLSALDRLLGQANVIQCPTNNAPEVLPGNSEFGGFAWSEIERAVGRLPATTGQAVVLRELHGLSHEEIGQRLGIKPTTARKRAEQGKAHLIAHLGQVFEYTFPDGRQDAHKPKLAAEMRAGRAKEMLLSRGP